MAGDRTTPVRVQRARYPSRDVREARRRQTRFVQTHGEERGGLVERACGVLIDVNGLTVLSQAGYFSATDPLSTTSGGGFGGPPSAFD
jgi:hypothetical protein